MKIIKKITKKLIKITISLASKFTSLVFGEDKKIYLIVGRGDKNEFFKRMKHFIPFYNEEIIYVKKFNFRQILSGGRLVVLDSLSGGVYTKYCRVYDLDYMNNHMDAWEWFDLASSYKINETSKNIKNGQKIFDELLKNFQKKYSRAFIFGTGPTLSKANELSWSEGVRIVSNTIVKDSKLWAHINPHIIVAGDALYHFGHTEFPIFFRRDLKARLENSDAVFVYPAIFDSLVQMEFSVLKNRLIPIPYFNGENSIVNLKSNYALPRLGNVLNQLLLPVATTFSREIYFWGFDGRSPSDMLFWKNSDAHFYAEHVNKLKLAHPAFFDFNVPNEDPGKYVNKVHGDKLNGDLERAEKKGFKFFMLHKSWTGTLNARYKSPEKLSFLKEGQGRFESEVQI